MVGVGAVGHLMASELGTRIPSGVGVALDDKASPEAAGGEGRREPVAMSAAKKPLRSTACKKAPLFGLTSSACDGGEGVCIQLARGLQSSVRSWIVNVVSGRVHRIETLPVFTIAFLSPSFPEAKSVRKE